MLNLMALPGVGAATKKSKRRSKKPLRACRAEGPQNANRRYSKRVTPGLGDGQPTLAVHLSGLLLLMLASMTFAGGPGSLDIGAGANHRGLKENVNCYH